MASNEGGNPETNAFFGKVLVFLLLLTGGGWLASKTSIVSSLIDTDQYWVEKIKEGEGSIEVDEYLIRTTRNEQSRRLRTASLDVSQAMDEARLIHGDTLEAKKAAIERIRTDHESDKEDIVAFSSMLERDRQTLDGFKRARVEAQTNPPSTGRLWLLAAFLSFASLMLIGIFRPHWMGTTCRFVATVPSRVADLWAFMKEIGKHLGGGGLQPAKCPNCGDLFAPAGDATCLGCGANLVGRVPGLHKSTKDGGTPL